VTRHLLVVCTANVCRSPTVERLLRRRLEGIHDLEGHTWTVRSAGTIRVDAQMDVHTLRAAAAIGIDLGDHVARPLDREVLDRDGADLVLAMTREHLRYVVGLDVRAWPRTFTLKELVRRAQVTPPATRAEGVAGWLRRVGEGRRAADLMTADPLDDIADPYGLPRSEHSVMIDETSALVDRLVQLGPWVPCPGAP
jgi:protein-tyrosine phosphatase